MADLHKRAACNALTLKSNNGLLDKMISKVKLLSPIDGKVLKEEINGLWDTGASRSVLDVKIIEELSLVSTGEVNVLTANGVRTAKEYCVTIVLPTGVHFLKLPVTDGEIGAGIHMLLGMDIITQGDFSITNVAKTVLTFRTPSIETVDFVQTTNLARTFTNGHKKKR